MQQCFNNYCFQEVFTIDINIFSEGFKQKCRAVSAISAHKFQMFSNSTLTENHKGVKQIFKI